MVKKAIFLDYATRVKGYKLWCPRVKSLKFVISRDVIFDENFILQQEKETVVDTICLKEEASKQVELESKFAGVQKSSLLS